MEFDIPATTATTTSAAVATTSRGPRLRRTLAGGLAALVALGVAPAAGAQGDDGAHLERADTAAVSARGGVSERGELTVDRGGELQLLTERTAAVVEGDTAWVALNWTSVGGAVDDVRITAMFDGHTPVGYPANTGDHAGPMTDYRLEDSEIDFAALQVSVPYGTDNAALVVYASYTSGGSLREEKRKVSVPVTRYTGTDLSVVTDEVVLVDGAGTVEVALVGGAPVLDDVQVRVIDPSEVYAEYPLRTHAGLAEDARLLGGRTDVARFHLDVTALGRGSHPVVLEITYSKGAERSGVKHELRVTW